MDDARTRFKVLDAIRGTPSFEQHAMKQGHAVRPLLSDIGDEDAGEVARMIVEVGFPEQVQTMLLTKIPIAPACEEKPTSQGTLQKWERFLDFGTQNLWDQVRVDGLDGNAILKLLVAFLLSIGLRHPSCPTFGVLACLYCWLQHGEDEVFNMSKMAKYKEVLYVKQYFQLLRDKAADPSEYVLLGGYLDNLLLSHSSYGRRNLLYRIKNQIYVQKIGIE